MVELRKDVDFEGPVITGFTSDGFKVGTQRIASGLLISPFQALAWEASAFADLSLKDIVSRLELEPAPEFLLFGSGPAMQQPPASFRREAEAMQIGIEVMDSRAAARIWGVLRAEERWIIGALLPLS
ncbi:MAG: Mth938-like domain-containing protein [Pseudomonadota bacterium]